MVRLRFLIVALTIWVVVLLNIERPDSLGIDLSSALYVVASISMVPALLIPKFGNRQFPLLLVPSIIVYLIMSYFGIFSDGLGTLPVVITETVILSVTIWLGYKVSVNLFNLEMAFDDLTLDNRVMTHEEGANAINQELFRARRYERPVSVMFIKLPTVSEITRRIGNLPLYQLSLEHRYIKGRVAEIISGLVYQVDFLVWDGDNLVICLPETDRQGAVQLAQKITRVIAPALNLELLIGIAVFPQDGLVYEDLLKVAKDDLHTYINSDKIRQLTPPASKDEKPEEVTVANSSLEPALMTQAKGMMQAFTSALLKDIEVHQGYSLEENAFSNNQENSWLDEIPFQTPTARMYYAKIKRVMDITIILLLSPFILLAMGLIALLVFLEDRGPIFFVQERTGFGGHRFKMYKFRTMVPDAEEKLKELAAQGLAVLDANGKLAQPLKLERDPRVTRIGRILRKTSLDELPQLWNVIRGEMSIVGPRPTSWDLNSYSLSQTERLVVRPGMTGLWQVIARGTSDFNSWVEWDVQYINRMSLAMDVQIIIRTVLVVLKRKEIVKSKNKDLKQATV